MQQSFIHTLHAKHFFTLLSPKQKKTNRQIPDLLDIPNEKRRAFPPRPPAPGRAQTRAHGRPRSRQRLPRARQTEQQRVAVPVRPPPLQNVLGLPHREPQVASGRSAAIEDFVGVSAVGRHAGEAAQHGRQAPDHDRDGDTVFGIVEAQTRRAVLGEDAVSEEEGGDSFGVTEDC